MASDGDTVTPTVSQRYEFDLRKVKGGVLEGRCRARRCETMGKRDRDRWHTIDDERKVPSPVLGRSPELSSIVVSLRTTLTRKNLNAFVINAGA